MLSLRGNHFLSRFSRSFDKDMNVAAKAKDDGEAVKSDVWHQPSLRRSVSDGDLTSRHISLMSSISKAEKLRKVGQDMTARLALLNDEDCGPMPHTLPIESGGLTLEDLKGIMKEDASNQVHVPRPIAAQEGDVCNPLTAEADITLMVPGTTAWNPV
jgi:hypothetical protein